MRHGSRPLALALSTALLLGAAPAAEPSATSEVTVLATGLRSSTGVVRACMTGDMATFPRCQTAGAAGAGGIARHAKVYGMFTTRIA